MRLKTHANAGGTVGSKGLAISFASSSASAACAIASLPGAPMATYASRPDHRASVPRVRPRVRTPGAKKEGSAVDARLAERLPLATTFLEEDRRRSSRLIFGTPVRDVGTTRPVTVVVVVVVDDVSLRASTRAASIAAASLSGSPPEYMLTGTISSDVSPIIAASMLAIFTSISSTLPSSRTAPNAVHSAQRFPPVT